MMKKSFPGIKLAFLAIAISTFFSTGLNGQIISSHPRNASDCEGISTIIYAVSPAKGVTSLSYYWEMLPYKSRYWEKVPTLISKGTETTSRLTLTFDKTTTALTTEMHNFQFRCRVIGTPLFSKPVTEYSKSAYLYVYTRPTITSHPSAATKNIGESVTFSVSASSSLSMSYTWQKNNVAISGATSSSYTISNIQEADAGNYRCLVSNSCGNSYSYSRALTVNPPADFPDGWSAQVSGTDWDLKRVAALNNLNAAAIGQSTNIVRKTANGGETWTNIPALTNTYWYSVGYPAANKIVVGGGNYFNYTVDGGTTWTAYNFYSELGLTSTSYVYDIEFISSTTGYACGSSGLVMKTTDAGQTWTLLHGNRSSNLVTDATLNDIFFLNASVGWAVGINGVIIKTTNGGTSWTKNSQANSMTGISFSDANNGLAVASTNKYILKTSDGGTTWTQVNSANIPFTIYPYAVHYTHANNAYVVGLKYVGGIQYGTILKTIDGGDTWKEQFTDGVGMLYDIDFVDANNGWAVGKAGEVQRTASGGCFTPTVNLGSDQSFCATGSYSIAADASPLNLNCSYEWTKDGVPTSSLPGITVNQTGVYAVEATSMCAVSAADTISIFVFDLPVVDAGEDIIICAGDSAQLDASGGVSYTWTNASYLNNANIQNPLAGPPQGLTTSFTVSATDENTCVNSDAVLVTSNFVSAGTISGNQTVCSGGDPALISSSNNGSSTGISTYSWESSTDNVDFTPIVGATSSTYNPPSGLISTTYFRRIHYSTISGYECSSISNLITVTVNDVTAGSINNNQTICSGDDPAAFISAGSGTGSGAISYTWQSETGNGNWIPSGGNSTTYDPGPLSTTTNFRRQATSTLNGVGCSSISNSVTITINDVNGGSINGTQTVCESGDPSNLSNSISGTGSGTISYQWVSSLNNSSFTNINGATGDSYNPPVLVQSTYYKRRTTSILNSISCVSESNSIAVSLNNPGAGTISGDQTICEGGDPVAITSNVAGSGPGTIGYRWESRVGANPFASISSSNVISFDPGPLSQSTDFRRVTISTLNSVACEAISNTVSITVNDLSSGSIGFDETICDGVKPASLSNMGSASGSGALSYNWELSTNGTSFSSIPGTNSPSYSPPVLNQTTWYRRVVSGSLNGNICTESTAAVKITVNPIPTSTFSAPVFVCGDGAAEFLHNGTSSPDSYTWSFESAQASSGETGGNPTANWEATNIGMKTISLIVEKDACLSDMTTHQVEVRAIPTPDFTAPPAVCAEAPATLMYTGSAPANATYTWTTTDGIATGSGQGPVLVSYATEGLKTVSLEVTQAECSSTLLSKEIMASYPYEGEKICIVTIDTETGKNMVVWEKTPNQGIDSYNVYRLGQGGVYNKLGSVAVTDISLFVDLTSEPEKTQYSYKISAVDTCGNESELSNFHKTIFLQYNGVNLQWQDYEIQNDAFDFSDFIIYRGSDSTALVQIDVVSGSNVYTDTDADANSTTMFYRVAGVLPNACDPAGIGTKKAGSGPFVHSLSNLEDNRIKTGVSDAFASSINLQLYPNPFNEQIMLSYHLNQDRHVKIELYNIVGEQISILYNDKQFAGSHKFDIKSSEFNDLQGLYYLKIHLDGQYITRKIILQ